MTYPPSEFRFSLLDAAGSYYFLGADNTVLLSATPVYLEHAPKGWEETEIKWQRSVSYLGLITTLTTPYELVLEGATIARHVYYTQGVEGYLKLKIECLRSAPDDWVYEEYFAGELAFSQFNDTEHSVLIAVREGGLNTLIRANESTPYEIPIDEDAVDVYLDGIMLGQEERFSLSQIGADIPGGFTGPIGSNSSPTLNKIYAKGNFGTNAYEREFSTDTSSNIGDNNFFYLASATNVATVNVNFSFFVNYLSGLNYAATRLFVSLLVRNGGSGIDRIDLYDADFPYNVVTHDISSVVSVPANTADYVALIVGVTDLSGNFINGSSANVEWHYNPGFLTIGYSLLNRPTTVKAFWYRDVYAKLVDKLTEGAYASISNFLADDTAVISDNRPYYTTWTCGNALRNLTETASGEAFTPAVRTTLKDLHKDCFGRWLLALGEENDQVVLEHLSYFFDDTEIVDVGEVSELSIIPAADFIGNLVNIGQETETYDEINGRDEFNVKQVRKLPCKEAVKEFDFVSPYRRDMYAIEYNRANLAGKTTTDNSSDNDNFLIEVGALSGDTYPVYRPQNEVGSTVSGLAYPTTAFNIPLSPGHDTDRLKAWFAMMCFNIAGKEITLQTTDKNSTVESDLGSGVIDEDAPLDTDALGVPPFQPVLIRFRPVVPVNMWERMKLNKRGYISLKGNGVSLKVFPFEISQKPVTNESPFWIGLSHPDNDLTQLIR